MKDKRLRIFNYGIALVMLIVVAALYPRLPEQIPTSWQFDGGVEYGSKGSIWIITGMLVLFAFMFDFMPYIDPRKKNYQKFGRVYDFFCVGLQIFLSITIGIIISESLFPGKIPTAKVVFVMLALIFILLGNYMPKIQSNFYMGIKTPWTLSSDEVWRKTHRLAGKLYMGSGILTLVSVFLLPMSVAGVVLMVLILGSSAVVGVASYVWWRKWEGGR